MNEIYETVEIIVPCTKKDDEIMQYQISFQSRYSTELIDIKGKIYYNEFIIKLSAELITLFGLNQDQNMYIYHYNYSAN